MTFLWCVNPALRRDKSLVASFRRPAAVILLLTCLILFLAFVPDNAAADTNEWQITSIKVCRDYRGNLIRNLEIIGRYPVYSFFIPRPVWTVNGTVVEAQPIYERGRLVAFRLLGAAVLLSPTGRNTVKFSLPDQSGSKIFRYDKSKPPPGECYEFF